MSKFTLKTLCGTESGMAIEYRELESPNHNPRFWLGRLFKPTLIVIHTAECAETAGAPDALAEWDAGPNRPKASWHFAVGDGLITCSVDPSLLAWHAGPVNPYSIGIEHAGRAAQTSEQWHDEYSTHQLRASADLVAVLCEIYQIPARLVSYSELQVNHKRGVASRGICGHADVTRALGGTHTDPGVAFPWVEYQAMIFETAKGAPLE